MCLECEKTIFVKCIKELEAFTVGKVYGVFSWYFDDEGCYVLTAMDDRKEECNIASGIEDNLQVFLNDEGFKNYFELSRRF